MAQKPKGNKTKKRKSRAKPVGPYLKAIQANKRFAPSLQRLSRRKTLTPAEKALVSRMANRVRHAGNPAALSRQQARALKNKSVMIGGGIRAVSLRAVEPGDQISIEHGELVVKKNGRKWVYRPVPPTATDLIDTGESAFEDDLAFQVNLWTVKGRAGGGAKDIDQWYEIISEAFTSYVQIDEWLLGIAILVEA